jgi:hypothetical protein
MSLPNDSHLIDMLLREAIEVVVQSNATGADVLALAGEIALTRPAISEGALSKALSGLADWRRAELALTAAIRPLLNEATQPPAGQPIK